MHKLLSFAAVIAVVTALPATAANMATVHSPTPNHGTMQTGGLMRVADNAGAEGEGVINTVDEKGGVVNITHGPIPALSWPEMTMDLPVTKDVDLSDVQPGDKVRFRVILGADQVYRITAID